MTRFPLLATAFALVAVSVAAPAAPAAVTASKSGQDADDVRRYWTPERMRNAKPVERAKGGKPGGGGGQTASWSTLEVAWPGPAIQRAHGKVFFSDGRYNYVCSGTAVSSSNGSVVWTAGHCVNEGPGAFYTNWEFVPAYNANGITAPYGEWPAASLYTTTAWRTTPNAYGEDLGAARVTTNTAGQTLATALGGNVRTLDFTPDTRTGETVNRLDAYGYPAAGKYNGQDMYACDTYVSRLDGSTSPPAYGMPCGMTGGSSGGGWVDDDDGTVFSVVSYGYQGLKDVLFGPQQGSSASSLLSSAGG